MATCDAAGDGLYCLLFFAGLAGFGVADSFFAELLAESLVFKGGFVRALAGRVVGFFELDFLSSFCPLLGTLFFSETSVDD